MKVYYQKYREGKYYSNSHNRYYTSDDIGNQIWLHKGVLCTGECITLEEVVAQLRQGVTKKTRDLVMLFETDTYPLKEHVSVEKWNGGVLVDLDLEKYQGFKKLSKSDIDTIYYDIIYCLRGHLNKNFKYIEHSSSGIGIHIYLKFDVERIESNYKKVALYVKDVLINNIDRYLKGFSKVLSDKNVYDDISTKLFQKCFITGIDGYFNEEFTGEFDISLCDYLSSEVKEKIFESSDIDNSGNLLVSNFKWDNKIEATKREYHHTERMWLMWSCLLISKTTDEALELYKTKIMPYFKLYRDYNEKIFLNAAKSAISNYDPKKSSAERLKPFGLSFDRKFIPERIDTYNADITIELKDNERLSSKDIPFKYDRINHLFAGCGVGKTFLGKTLGKEKEYFNDIEFIFDLSKRKNRVCFICPLNSISYGSFEDTEGWMIVDGEHKGNRINDKINVCTSWESFVIYKMYEMNFDYYIVDEIHSLYQYDFRLNSIVNMKKYFPTCGGIKIFMTGTPSYETKEFNTYNIRVVRDEKPIYSDVILYNDSYKGYIEKDLKEWTKDKSHAALIFYDPANYKQEEFYSLVGFDVDMFNKSYEDNTHVILTSETIRKQVTIFSIYGQAGINLYLQDKDGNWLTDFRKVRIYILSNEAMSIIQYANRMRQKELIDKVIITYKKDKITNDILAIDDNVSYNEPEHKLEILKDIRDKSVISYKNKISDKRILKAHYGLHPDVANWDYLELYKDKYKAWKLIEAVKDYEKQLQIIYNRLCDNYFEVNFVDLENDIDSSIDTKLRSNVFAGKMGRFDSNMIKKSIDGERVYFIPDNETKKVLTGDIGTVIENILNYIYKESGYDIEKTKDIFINEIIKDTIRRNDTIKKADFKSFELYYKLNKNWGEYCDNSLLYMISDDRYDDCLIATIYMRSIWSDKFIGNDWMKLADECYDDVKSIRSKYNKRKDLFDNLVKSKIEVDGVNSIQFKDDDIAKQIYWYYKNKQKSASKIKVYIYEGKRYNGLESIAKKTGKSLPTIKRWVKEGKIERFKA